MPLRSPRTLLDENYFDPLMFGGDPAIMAAPGATVPDRVVPTSYLDSLLTPQTAPTATPVLSPTDAVVPQGNPVGSLGSDGVTPIPDYLGEYLASTGAPPNTTGVPYYPQDNTGVLGPNRPHYPSEMDAYPDLWTSPGTFSDSPLSGYVPPQQPNVVQTPTVQTPAPAPAPTTPTPTSKANPNTQPIVETQGFLPAAQPAPLTLDQKRAQFLNQATQGFGYNYGRNLIPDNSLDDTITSILGEQKGQAQTYLDRGKARGIYNDVGYNAGQNKINTQSQAGGSQLASLGSDVLDKYRTKANKVRDDAFGSISGLVEGQDFSLDPYFGEGNAIRATEQRNAPGDLRTALGGQSFFDFQGLTNAAGQAQGALNLRDADVATALAAQKERAAKGRGLGSEGAF